MRTIEEKDLIAYKVYLQYEEKSPNTIEKYMRDVGSFVIWLDAQEKQAGITKESAIAYKEYLQKTYKPGSANSMLVALNGFFAYLGWDECKVKTIKTQPNHIYAGGKELTQKDYQKLVRTAKWQKKDRLAMIIETIASTGIRISELKHITVEAVKKGKVEIACKGKHREIYIVHKLRTALLKYCKDHGIRSGSVFVTRNGNPINRSNLWAEMKRLGRDAGVDVRKVFPHNFRHFFARTYYQMHKNISWLADILGHSSINTTRIYTATTEENHIKMLEKLRLVI